MDSFRVAKVKKWTTASVGGDAEQRELACTAGRCVRWPHRWKDGVVVLASLEHTYTSCSSNPGYLLNRTALMHPVSEAVSSSSHQGPQKEARALQPSLRQTHPSATWASVC